MIDELLPLYEVLRDCCPPSRQRDEALGEIEAIAVAACDAMARAGVHTPNHRWKMASALVLADRLWPHDAWSAEAGAYLDEGIDIDADGEFAERSSGCYNYVCDRALILLGRSLGRADYLDLADRNLEHMLHLLHADGTLVTSYSRRQDRHTTVGIERYALLYWYRALTAGNGRFLSAAELAVRRLLAGAGSLAGLTKWLRYFRDAAESAPPKPEPLPEDYEARFDGVGVLRRRLGSQSLTLMTGPEDVLAVRFGAGPEVTLRLAAGIAPRGQFAAERIGGRDGSYTLRSHHACEYYGPGPDPLPATDWRERAGFARRVFVSTELTMHLSVESSPAGVRLHLRSDGCPRVPVEVAFIVRDAEEIVEEGQVDYDDPTRKHFLNAGSLLLRGPGHTVRIGEGAAEHDLTEIPTAKPYPTRHAYCIRLVTPLEHHIDLRVQ